MFNLGSDDKDDLQENMKEIKNMIQREGKESSGQNSGIANDGDEFGSPAKESSDFGSSENTGFGDKQQNRQHDQVIDSGSGDRNRFDNNRNKPQRNQQDSQSQEKSSRRQRSQSATAQGMQRPENNSRMQNTEGSQNQRMNASEESNPLMDGQDPQDSQEDVEKDSRRKVIRSEPKKETKNTGKKSSGPGAEEPLFLKEEEFREIREMVEEMSYLSQEMTENLDRMRTSVRKERDTSKNVNELVEGYSQRRSDIESVIEAGQK